MSPDASARRGIIIIRVSGVGRTLASARPRLTSGRPRRGLAWFGVESLLRYTSK
jgi:hypothetical protein